MQCYVTYDATTYGVRRGIFERESITPPCGYIIINGNKGGEWFPNKYWFKNLNYAIKNAEKQREAKIQQLESTIERIKRMEFK